MRQIQHCPARKPLRFSRQLLNRITAKSKIHFNVIASAQKERGILADDIAGRIACLARRRDMKQKGIGVLLALAITLFFFGCVPEPGIDKGKLSEFNRTAQELKSAIASGKPCDVQDSVLQGLVSGTAALKDKATTKEERDLIAAYSNLAAIYRDGLLLCRSQSNLSEFPFVPKGRIYVFQELDPIVEKYGLPTERHVFKQTGQSWRSISTDSIKVVWESAQAQIKNIDIMMNYK